MFGESFHSSCEDGRDQAMAAQSRDTELALDKLTCVGTCYCRGSSLQRPGGVDRCPAFQVGRQGLAHGARAPGWGRSQGPSAH